MYLTAGINYIRRNDLPEGTIQFEDLTLNVVDSTFRSLAAFGQASLILLNSNVFLSNVTFDNNYQSQAGAIMVNQTSNATIVNSVFNNNFGYQAGAISVACTLSLLSHAVLSQHQKVFGLQDLPALHCKVCCSMMYVGAMLVKMRVMTHFAVIMSMVLGVQAAFAEQVQMGRRHCV